MDKSINMVKYFLFDRPSCWIDKKYSIYEYSAVIYPSHFSGLVRYRLEQVSAIV